MVTKWSAPIKNYNSICINPECLSIQVGEYSDGESWGIELELFITSSGFESICFNEAYSIDKEKNWTNSIMGMSTRKLELPSLKKAKIFFYADRSFWENQVHDTYIVDFFVGNRIDIPYREKFELIIMSLTDKTIHKENEAFCI